MDCRGIDPALRRSVERGQYVVDSRAVAQAMLRSKMFVAAQIRDGSARSQKDQPATG